MSGRGCKGVCLVTFTTAYELWMKIHLLGKSNKKNRILLGT